MNRFAHLSTLIICLLLSLSLASCQNNVTLTDAGLKVISYNIRYSSANDGPNDWNIRKPASIVMLKEQNPDVFGLQEALQEQIDYLEANLPKYKSVGVGREDGLLMGEQMSIFYDTTRVCLMDWGTYWLSETPSVPSYGWGAQCKRTATWTKMKHLPDNHIFYYVNTHLDHVSSEARKNGLKLIVSKIAEMNTDQNPMILTGDFNIPPTSDNLVELNSVMTSARDAAEVTTEIGSFNGWGKYGSSDSAPTWDGPVSTVPMQIDYIYYSGFGKCESFKVLDQSYCNVEYISDHYPVVAVLKF